MTEITMLVQKYYILCQSPIWGAVQKFIQKGAHQRGKRSHKWEIYILKCFEHQEKIQMKKLICYISTCKTYHTLSTTLVVGLQTMRLQKKLHNTSWKITIESVPAKPNSWFMETALGLKTLGY
jgi:hypothetical protein